MLSMHADSSSHTDVVYSNALLLTLNMRNTLAAKQAENWEVVRGVDVLLEQGFAQFHTWTDRHCPRRAVSDAVWKAYRTT